MYNVHSVSFLFSCNILCHSQFLHRLKFSTSAKLFKKGNIQFTCRYNKVCSFFLRRVELFGFFGMGWGGKTNYIWSTRVSKKLVKEIIIDLQCMVLKFFRVFAFVRRVSSTLGTQIRTLHCYVLDEVRWWTMMNDDVLDTTELCHRFSCEFE